MEITSTSAFLAEHGIAQPNFNALIPSIKNYPVLLFQPQGHIEVLFKNELPTGIQNKDTKLMFGQFDFFIRTAMEEKADLAITPEYSMPWSVLIDAVKKGRLPEKGRLWAFGCESITYAELQALQESLSGHCKLIFEDLQEEAGRFLDPLVYIFLSKDLEGANPLAVLLVQFKTCPMGDRDHFEVNGLQCGEKIYEFLNSGESVRLLSLICSDVFDFETEGHGKLYYDRSLIIHIQLQKDPRHVQYRKYRDSLLKYGGDQTEVLCLNWSGGVQEWAGGKQTDWKNISGSAWYIKSREFDLRDANLCANHRNGLYYTWLESLRTHSLFFNYLPAIHLLTATKVFQHGVEGPRSSRVGPKLTKSWIWLEKKNLWELASGFPDGFEHIVNDSDDAKENIAQLASDNPFVAERVLALSVGSIARDEAWHRPDKLDSCLIDLKEEIRRITFAQDIRADIKTFRTARLKRCGRLLKILKNPSLLPKALADLMEGFNFSWSISFPHQNIISQKGNRATAIYAGEDINSEQLDGIAITISEFLRRADADRQRLVIWYRGANDKIITFDLSRFLDYERDDTASEYDIMRTQ